MIPAGVRRVCSSAAVALVFAAGAHSLQAQDAANFPNKVIKLVVGFAAGGGNDIFARLVGAKLEENLGQTVIVENKPGAGGRLAVGYATSQPADGHTLLVAATGQMAVAAAIYPKLPYHPTATLIPLTMIANFPLILVVSPDHPARTVKDLVAWAKANPGKANYASSSPAFIITTELFKLKSGMPGQMIPYKSSNEMLQSVVGGHTLLTIADGGPTMPLVKGGKVRALAVTGSERSPELPDVPSMAEVGFPEVDIKLWSGFFATPGTPPAIVNRLEAEIRRALADAGVQQKLKAQAVIPGGGPSGEFRKLIDADIQKYVEIVKAANLTFPE
jgi:tripartite-type tricarboxylate transporter receptor subunit TctC